MSNILNKKRNLLPFDGEWLDAIGCPELTGSWIVYADSGQGKTTFVMQLAKYLTQFDRVLYDSLEEGDSETIKQALLRTGMAEVGGRFLLLDKWRMHELTERLAKRNAPKVVVIDSVQYSGLSYAAYQALIDAHRDTLFIWVSHEKNKEPKGSVAQAIEFDAHVKIRCEGFRAFVRSRYKSGDAGFITIWPEGAAKYWSV